MAAPMAGVTSATQLALQKAQDPAAQQLTKLKQGSSKFDQVMAQKADPAQQVQAAGQVNKAQQVQQVQQTQKVSEVSKTEKAALNKIRPDAVSAKAAEPVQASGESSRMVDHMAKMMTDLEKGQGIMDTLITKGLSGKQISNSQLLALQAGMYKYTQELELTGKVVEKATSGLKDTLKTQV